MTSNPKAFLAKIISYEFLLIVLILAGLAGSLSTMELRNEEPRRAIVAMEMLLGDNVVVPKIYGYNYYNKPPLFNWILAATFSIFGSFDEVFVRLPSLLAYLFTAWLVFKVVSSLVDRKTGFISAMLLLVAVDILFYGAVNAGEIDLFLMLLFFVQAIAFFHFSQKQQWWSAFIISYVMAAAGVLTKGLPVIVIHGLMIGCWLIYARQFKKLFSLSHFAALLIFAGIVGVYFFAYHQQADATVYLTQLVSETANRALPGNKAFGVLLNFLQSPFQLFYISLPASALLLYALNKKVRNTIRVNRLFMFCFLFTLISTIPFFASQSTANRYLYPAFPFIAIMAGMVFTKAASITPPLKRLVSYKVLLGVFFLLAMCRIVYNVWGIPYQKKVSTSLIYKSKSAELLQISKGKPIYLTGFIEKNIASPKLFFIKMKPTEIATPPMIPYQFAYYITKQTNTIMRYDSIPQKGWYYLTPTDFLEDKAATIHQVFHNQWTGKDLALVTFK